MRRCSRALFAGALILALAACTGTGSHDTGPTTSASGTSTSVGSSLPATPTTTKRVSAQCATLRATGLKISQAEVQLYTASNGKSAAVDTLVTELNALKSGAPASIKSALADLASGFTQAQALLAHPSSANTSTLAQIGSKLAADSQKVSQYVASKC
jgi:hypothetical protein